MHCNAVGRAHSPPCCRPSPCSYPSPSAAFFEYCLQVPANRMGHFSHGGPFTAPQLKIIQEAVRWGLGAWRLGEAGRESKRHAAGSHAASVTNSPAHVIQHPDALPPTPPSGSLSTFAVFSVLVLKEKLCWVDAVAFALIFSGVAVSLAKPGSTSASSEAPAPAPGPEVAMGELPVAPAPESEQGGAGRRLLGAGGPGPDKASSRSLSSNGHEVVELLRESSAAGPVVTGGASAYTTSSRRRSQDPEAGTGSEAGIDLQQPTVQRRVH